MRNIRNCSRKMELTLQDIQADTAETIDVGVVDLGQETDLRRGHRVVVRQKQLETEDTTCLNIMSNHAYRHEVE